MLGDAPSAYAEVVDAAEAAAATSSGVVTVEIDLRRLVDTAGPEEAGTVRLEYRYSGDDYALDTVFAVAAVGDEPDPHAVEMRRVGDVEYIGTGGSWTSMPAADEPDPLGPDLLGLGFGAPDADPERIVGVVEAAVDVERVATDDGVTTYTGTVTAAALEALDAKPAGIAMIADEPGNLPDTSRLTVEVVNGVLRSIRLDAVGAFPGSDTVDPGEVDATITTTFSDLGAPITIEAPPADQVTPRDERFAEIARNAQIVDDHLASHPDSACLTDSVVEPQEPVDMDAFVEQVAECFEAEGVPEVADAWRAMNTGLD